jgi:hypothetical protein
MATAVARINTPVSLHEAFYALSVARDEIKRATTFNPDYPSVVSIRLEASGAMKAEIIVGGPPTTSVENQQRIAFVIENNMIPGCRLANPVPGFENGRSSGRRTVTALLTKESE